MEQRPALESSRATAVDWTIAACTVVFVAVLAIAAYWDASIRVVHAFESLPYLAAAVLCVRQKKVGYALGVTAGILWLGLAGRGSTFIVSGFQVLSVVFRTHHLIRPDMLIAVPGAIATAGLVLFSLAGYIRLRDKAWADAGLFAGSAALITAFFFAIFTVFSPQFLVPLRHMFAL